MKRKTINGHDYVMLSRRNLLTLLAKLDGHPPNSACMIGGGSDAPKLWLMAEEDDVHYKDRPVHEGVTKFGPMHPETEAALGRMNGRRVR